LISHSVSCDRTAGMLFCHPIVLTCSNNVQHSDPYKCMEIIIYTVQVTFYGFDTLGVTSSLSKPIGLLQPTLSASLTRNNVCSCWFLSYVCTCNYFCSPGVPIILYSFIILFLKSNLIIAVSQNNV
jgi:hypothetical protein